ncbi:MAG: hypothetical protein KF726_18580 [Anaerolineae bacterium]|nr:hypothetical protein [Anaerolineae bacterium]
MFRNKRLVPAAAILIVGLLLASCSPPPPLISQNYLKDTSLISGQPCDAPCYQNITVGKDTFVDAVNKIKANTMFKDVQTKDATSDQPAVAVWSTVDSGEQCCQMIARTDGVVESITLRLAPQSTVGQVIDKFGEPPYTFSASYTDTESVIQLLYPTHGLLILVVPGDANSSLEAGDPVVAAIYLDPERYDQLVKEATLQGWAGYVSFTQYLTLTPIVTPIASATPSPTPGS